MSKKKVTDPIRRLRALRAQVHHFLADGIVSDLPDDAEEHLGVAVESLLHAEMVLAGELPSETAQGTDGAEGAA